MMIMIPLIHNAMFGRFSFGVNALLTVQLTTFGFAWSARCCMWSKNFFKYSEHHWGYIAYAFNEWGILAGCGFSFISVSAISLKFAWCTRLDYLYAQYIVMSSMHATYWHRLLPLECVLEPEWNALIKRGCGLGPSMGQAWAWVVQFQFKN